MLSNRNIGAIFVYFMVLLVLFQYFNVDIIGNVCYNKLVTQIVYFIPAGKYFGKRCFLSLPISSRVECNCVTTMREPLFRCVPLLEHTFCFRRRIQWKMMLICIKKCTANFLMQLHLLSESVMMKNVLKYWKEKLEKLKKNYN